MEGGDDIGKPAESIQIISPMGCISAGRMAGINRLLIAAILIFVAAVVIAITIAIAVGIIAVVVAVGIVGSWVVDIAPWAKGEFISTVLGVEGINRYCHIVSGKVDIDRYQYRLETV